MIHTPLIPTINLALGRQIQADLLSSRPTQSTEQVPGQQALHRKTLSQEWKKMKFPILKFHITNLKFTCCHPSPTSLQKGKRGNRQPSKQTSFKHLSNEVPLLLHPCPKRSNRYKPIGYLLLSPWSNFFLFPYSSHTFTKPTYSPSRHVLFL